MGSTSSFSMKVKIDKASSNLITLLAKSIIIHSILHKGGMNTFLLFFSKIFFWKTRFYLYQNNKRWQAKKIPLAIVDEKKGSVKTSLIPETN